jgi:alpha-L-arabinofuranosidase
LNADIVDEHYYASPEWFFRHVGRYDAYDRKGPKLFAGEYAAQSKGIAKPDNENNWLCALSEAAFMTGLERNADVVQMASYAPLFAHADAWQWTPDLIWFNNLKAYATPSYYVQKLFATNKGTHAVPVLEDNEAVKGKDSLYASSVIDQATGDLILKIVNASSVPVAIQATVAGAKLSGKEAGVQVIASADATMVNSFASPEAIVPVTAKLPVKKEGVATTLKPLSLTVIRVGIRK